MRVTKELFIANQYYHVYNRAVGSEKMFLDEGNYYYFLQRMQHHILPIADIFCYAFLPNHFHLFLRIKTQQAVEDFFQKSKTPSQRIKYDVNRSLFIAEQFGNWCNGYTKAFNKKYNRKGKLFMDNLNRKQINSQTYYTKIIHYIHANAAQHGLCKKIDAWPYSSYQSCITNNNNWLKKAELLGWFGSLENFINFHNQPIELKMKRS